MCKLLSANFYRLFINRNLQFIICFVFLILYSVFFLLFKQINVGIDIPYWEDKVYFNFSLCIQTLVMFFSIIYLGAEYSSGAIRNNYNRCKEDKYIPVQSYTGVFRCIDNDGHMVFLCRIRCTESQDMGICLCLIRFKKSQLNGNRMF